MQSRRLKLLVGFISTVMLLLGVAADEPMTITSMTPSSGSLNGGTLVTFSGTISTSIQISDIAVKVGNLDCLVLTYPAPLPITTVVPNDTQEKTLFSCMTDPLYPTIDKFPAAVFTEGSQFSATFNVNVTIGGIPAGCSVCSFTYSRILTPTILGMNIISQDIASQELAESGPRHLVVQDPSKIYVDPLIVELVGFFMCEQVQDCIEYVEFTQPLLPGADVPTSFLCQPTASDQSIYGYTPSNGTTPGRLRCGLQETRPGSFIPKVVTSQHGNSLLIDNTLWKRDSVGVPSIFSFNPIITSLETPSASHRGGAQIIIRGRGLTMDKNLGAVTDPTPYDVYIGNIPCNVVSAQYDKIVCTLNPGWEQSQLPKSNVGIFSGVRVYWWDTWDDTLYANVFNRAVNPKFNNTPDRWYVSSTFESPLLQSDIRNANPAINQWDRYGQFKCASFTPTQTGNYRFSLVCQTTCQLWMQNFSSNAATMIAQDMRTPSSQYIFWISGGQSVSQSLYMEAGKSYRLELYQSNKWGEDFVGIQYEFQRNINTRGPIPQALLTGCYDSKLTVPLTGKYMFVGERGLLGRRMGPPSFYANMLGQLMADIKVKEPSSKFWIDGTVSPSNLAPGDIHWFAYLVPPRDGVYSFEITMSGVTLPEAELYIILDDDINGPVRTELLAHTYARSYTGRAQESRSINLRGRHPYLLQFFQSDNTVQSTISMTEYAVGGNIVYSSIPSDMLRTAETYPSVSVSLYNSPAICGMSNGCAFKFTPIIRDIIMPPVVQKGSVIRVQLDTWSIKQIVGNEILNIDGASCPLTSFNVNTRYLTCTVAEDRYGGIIDIQNITIGALGLGDAADLNVESYFPFHLASAAILPTRGYTFTSKDYLPYQLSLVLGGYGFGSITTEGGSHRVQASFDGAPCAVAVPSGAALSLNNLVINCPVDSFEESYELELVQTHAGVTITNSTTVVVSTNMVYDQLMFYKSDPLVSTLTKVTVSQKAPSLDSVVATFDLTGPVFADEESSDPSPLWYNEVYRSINQTSGQVQLVDCNITSASLPVVTADCVMPLRDLAKDNLTITTFNSVRNFTHSSPIAYNATYVNDVYYDVSYSGAPVVKDTVYDFSATKSRSVFDVNITFTGSAFGRVSAGAASPAIPSYYHDVLVFFGNTTLESCAVTEVSHTTLTCRARIINDDNPSYTFTVQWIEGDAVNARARSAVNVTHLFDTADIAEKFRIWQESQRSTTSKEDSINIGVIVGPVVAGAFLIGGFAVFKLHPRFRKSRNTKVDVSPDLQNEDIDNENVPLPKEQVTVTI